jgi:hypothetical protein
VTQSLLGLVDVVLGEALLSIAYEVNFDVPRAASWAAARAASRHDFGLEQQTQDARVRRSWAIPRRIVDEGASWHITGAALGLDIAVPSFSLRRIDSAPPAKPPAIVDLERDAFATSVALMNPFALRNDDLDAVADAVARGQRRVDALLRDDGDASALTRDIAMDGWRRRALQWDLHHDRTRIQSLFSTADLLYLGGGRDIELDAWGMPALSAIGCVCTRLSAPGAWTALVGRPETALLTTTVADLNLQVALALADMRLPAALAKSVLAIAVQDFVTHVQLAHGDDWLGRVRAARDIGRDRIEDYISVATINGPLIPDVVATQVTP